MDSNNKQVEYASLDLAGAMELLEEKDGELSLLIHRLKQLDPEPRSAPPCRRPVAERPS